MINSIQKKAAKVGLGAFLKTSSISDDDIIDLRNLIRDYYYFKDLQFAIVLKLNAELRVSFPAYPKVFSKITTQTSLKLLYAYPLASDMLEASDDEVVKTIQSTARFGKSMPLPSMIPSAMLPGMPLCLERALPSNATRIRLYIDSYWEYQKHLDSILEELRNAVDKL